MTATTTPHVSRGVAIADPGAMLARPIFLGRSGWLGFMLVGAFLLVVVPALATFPTEGSSLRLSDYAIALFGKYLCYAIMAVAMDLIWGYAGILSLGQTAFFALGGYAMGMYLMREIGDRGVYKNPTLPDFMVFLGWNHLPMTWWGFNYFAFACVMVVVVPGLLAAIFGWFAFRSRVTGVYLSIITQALTYALMLAFFLNDIGFGGNNGLTDFKDIVGYDVAKHGTRVGLYMCTVVALGLAFLLCRYVVGSRIGRVLLAVRDGESRVRFLGYDTVKAKLFVFVLAAVLSGIAGALYVPQVGIINPSEFAPGNSIEVAIWVAVGGRGTLVGAILGAVLVNLAKTWLTGAFPDLWLFALGALFILVTLLMPKGVLGLPDQFRRLRESRGIPKRIEPPSAAAHSAAAELGSEEVVHD
jgi:urea transport system permease protein